MNQSKPNPETGEIRQDKVTKEWVIYAPARRKRPRDFKKSAEQRRNLPSYDENCPFCPGNEDMLPGILLQTEGDNEHGWQTRVVPNKFPALTSDGKKQTRFERGIYLAMHGVGGHEVIIETPYHNRNSGDMELKETETLVETYHRRYLNSMSIQENMMAIIFRNHGPRAGTSLIHPHSQMIVTGMVPRYIRIREEESQRYHDQWGSCVYCDILEFEVKDQTRLIFENESYISFVPFSADIPFEIWILPKQHRATFADVTDTEKRDLAEVLCDNLGRLFHKLGDPDYNYVINSAARYKADEPHLHWYMQIRPRLTTRAGFEIGSGVRINPSIPEHDAAFLRGV
jgi:UDPglucose--hexose-1-phosphate uridylyltransferase